MNQSGNVRFGGFWTSAHFGALEFLFLPTFLWGASQDFRDATTGFAVWLTEGRGNLHPPQGSTIHQYRRLEDQRLKNINCGIYVWKLLGVHLCWVVATQIFLLFSSRNLGKMNPFWRSNFSDGLVQPPTSSLFPTQKSAWPRLRFITFLLGNDERCSDRGNLTGELFVETIPIGSMGLVYLPTFS